MKHLLKIKTIALLVTLGILSTQAAAQHGGGQAFAVVYSETNFQGWSYRILPGDSIPSFEHLRDGRWAFLNRDIESVEIHGEMSLELWNSSHFSGQSTIIDRSTRNLSNWNNQTLSVKANRIQKQPPRRDPAQRSPERRRPNPGEVIFFEDDAFRGEALIFERSESIPRLTEYYRGNANWNDVISSIAINGNYVVTLFEHANYQGRSIRIEDSATAASQLKTERGRYENWNDRISSLKIERLRGRDNPPGQNDKPVVSTLYEDSAFRGKSLSLFDGQQIQDLDTIKWNDRASSIEIDPNHILVLYEHTHFRGKSARISSDQENLKRTRTHENRVERWNDHASSLKVIRK